MNRKPCMGCFTLFKPKPWILGRLERERPGLVMFQDAQSGLMWQGQDHIRMKYTHGQGCTLCFLEDWALYPFPWKLSSRFLCYSPNPRLCLAPWHRHFIHGLPKSSPSLPVLTLNGLWTRFLHSAAIIHHLEKVSFCLIRMSVVYRLALKILMAVFPSDNNRTIYFHLLHLL